MACRCWSWPPLPPADREFADGEALLAAIRDWESA